jgi:hypothetical protein
MNHHLLVLLSLLMAGVWILGILTGLGISWGTWVRKERKLNLKKTLPPTTHFEKVLANCRAEIPIHYEE